MTTRHPLLPASGEVLGFVLGALRLRSALTARVPERTLRRALGDEVGVKVDTRREVITAAVEILLPDELIAVWEAGPTFDPARGADLRAGIAEQASVWLANWDAACGNIRSHGSPVPDVRFAVLPWVRLIGIELALRAAGYLLFRGIERADAPDLDALMVGRSFDTLVARYRNAAGGLARDDLARGSGVAESTVDEWLAGKSLPQGESILSLAAVVAKHVPGLAEAEASFHLRLATCASDAVRRLWEVCPPPGLGGEFGPPRAAQFAIEALVVLDYAMDIMRSAPFTDAERRGVYWALATMGSTCPHGKHILAFALGRARDSFIRADIEGVLNGRWTERVLMLYRQIPAVEDPFAWGKVAPNPGGWLTVALPGDAKAPDADDGDLVLHMPTHASAAQRDTRDFLEAEHVKDNPQVALAKAVALAAAEPRDSMKRFWLGCALARVGRTDEAIVECAIAGDLKPGWALPAVEIAIILSNAGRNPEALEVMRRISGKYAVDDHLANCYGYVLMTAGHVEEAIGWFRQAIDKNPDHARALLHLADCLLSIGQRVEGRKWAKAARHRGEPAAYDALQAGKYGA